MPEGSNQSRLSGKKGGKKYKSVKQAVLSLSAESYAEPGKEKGRDVEPEPQKQNTRGHAIKCFEKSPGNREYSDKEKFMTRNPEK